MIFCLVKVRQHPTDPTNVLILLSFYSSHLCLFICLHPRVSTFSRSSAISSLHFSLSSIFRPNIPVNQGVSRVTPQRCQLCPHIIHIPSASVSSPSVS